MNFLVQLFLFSAASYVSTALAPKPKSPKPAAIDEFEFPQIDEGTPQTVIFGDCWSEGWFVLGIGNFRTPPIKK